MKRGQINPFTMQISFMNKFNFIIICILILVSCSKESISDFNSKYLIAGDSISKEVFFSGVIDTLLDCEEYFSHKVGMGYAVDINDDKVNDFSILAYSSGGLGGYSRYMHIVPQDSSDLICTTTCDTLCYIKILYLGDTICKQKFWTNQSSFFLKVYSGFDFQLEKPFYCVYGDWNDVYNNYAGLMKIVENDTIYGWIRLDVYDGSKIIIKDYAYRK